jgi:chromate reductase, NAD(P)H dehydrogenase (quinone)
MSNVITICGSLRKGSYNRMLANLLPSLAPAGMNIKPAPSIEMPIYNADVQAQGFPPQAVALGDAVRAADGVIIVSPEYNFSIPGGLKNAIDWVSRMENQPFKDKPLLIQSAANGILGGGRMQYHLRTTAIFLDAIVFGRPEVFIGQASTKFDDKTGQLKDETAIKIIKTQLEGFEKFIAKMSGK